MRKSDIIKIGLLVLTFLLLAGCTTNASLLCNTSCTDNDIKTNIQVKIAGEACLNDQNIRVTSYERRVTLNGSVENPTQRTIAGNLAKSVPGVLVVVNKLKIKDKYNRPV